jgi:putative photosynthetic complex assembly protein 2
MATPVRDGISMEPLDAIVPLDAATASVRTDESSGRLFVVARDVVVVLLYWWLATGVIFLIQRDPITRLAGIGLATGCAAVGWGLVVFGRDDATPRGSLRGFLGAALLWAWPQTLLYAGLPAGPSDAATRALPFALGSLPLAVEAVRATIVNDVIGVGVMVAIAAVTFRGAHRMALWTYATLWFVQQSAKVNIFFGVSHAGAEFLPKHLRYLARYFGPAENSPLLGATIIALTLIALLLGWRAAMAKPGYIRHASTLIVSVLALAVVEHLVIGGVFDAPLWRLFLDARGY